MRRHAPGHRLHLRPAFTARVNSGSPAARTSWGRAAQPGCSRPEGELLLSGTGAEHVTLRGLVLDGAGRPLLERRGLAQLESRTAIKIADCTIAGSGRNGIVCIAVAGEVSDSTIAQTADAGLFALDSAGLLLARNRIHRAGNNGIQVWRSMAGEDGTLIIDNRLENIGNRSGGSGQDGNAINVFRAGNVIVRGNRIANCAFSAVRGNAASNLQIEGNSISNTREFALYAEFAFEGAVIANNSVDLAAVISVTNFNEGGRLAVVQGNIIRNLLPGGRRAPIQATQRAWESRSRPTLRSPAMSSRTLPPPA